MSRNLFAADSDSNEDDLEIKLNKEYSKSYNKFRQKELYQKLKEQDKNNSDSNSSSDSESTDEDIEIVDPKFDKEFFKTLSSLKSKDPKIYDKNTNFFENVINDNPEQKSNKSNKPITLKDYERKVILESNGKFKDDSDSDDNFNQNIRSASPTYVEDERKLKEEFKNVINNDDGSENEEFGGIFKRRQKTNIEKTKEEEEYTKWLAGEHEDIEESTKRTLNPLREFWNNPKLSKQEKFLRDYILNKGYADKDCHEIPTYDEIVGGDDEDEKELEKQAEFEHKFNFRFEEPDKEFIKRYPRTIENSVRKTNDNRRQKRLETKERKDREKEEKMKQLEILKEMKRLEIEEKIKKLKEVTGNDELPFQNDEFDNDFDPDAHDKKMQQIFNDDYYGIEEDDEEKPECPDIDELKYEDWDNYDPEKDDEYYENTVDDNIPNCEDEDFVMDCDYNPNSKETLQNELIENTKSRKKRNKKHNQFKEMIKKEKPVFNPEDEKTYGEYIDEYYKMDFEDMIGDTPCRFKYVETVPNDFGLTIEEILLAKNKELNQWASLKKSTQIRSEHVEKNERKLYNLKSQNLALKKKIFPSLYASSDEEEEIITKKNVDTKENKPTQSNNDQPIKSNKRKNKKRKISSISEDCKDERKILKLDENAKNSINKISVKKNEIFLAKVDPKHAKKSEINTKKNNNKKKIPNVNNFAKNINTETEGLVEKKVVIEKNLVEKTLNKSGSLNPFQTKASVKGKLKGNIKPNQFKNKIQSNGNNNKNKFDKCNNKNNEFNLSDDRLKAYGINPKKFNKKQKFLNMNNKKNVKNEILEKKKKKFIIKNTK